jgi:hypothetical protein
VRERVKGARTTAGILSFIAAGFFFYGVGLLAFVSTPEWWVKVVIVATFVVPAAVFFGLGAWCWGRNVLQSLGIVLLSAAGMTALVVLTFVSMLMTPEYAKLLPAETRQLFSSVRTGATCLGGYVVIGLALLLAVRRNSRITDVA